MAWAEIKAVVSSDERLGQVASRYRRMGLRGRSNATLEELCEGTGIQPVAFVVSVVAQSICYVDLSALLEEAIGGPVRLMNLYNTALEPGGGEVRRRFLADWGIL